MAPEIDVEERSRALRAFLGVWRGEGRGSFPGIEPFRYAEQVEFRTRDGEASVLYEQQTWVLDEAGGREPSHWEAGFLQVTEDGRVDLLNAQNSGRVEVLRGDLREAAGGNVELILESVVHGHDPRMVATRRRYVLAGNELVYEVDMATRKVPGARRHLDARLTRG